MALFLFAGIDWLDGCDVQVQKRHGRNRFFDARAEEWLPLADIDGLDGCGV